MNTTANNQGDHCIIPLSNGTSVGGLPVIDSNNLEGTRALCQQLKKDSATANAAVLAALIAVVISQSGGTVDPVSVNTTVQEATVNAASSVQGAASQYRYAQSVETARLTTELGPNDPRIVQMQSQLTRTDAGIKQLNVELQRAAAPETAVPQGGVVVNGRITDSNSLGRADLTVELAKRDGTSLGITATTDAAGNYSMSLDAETAKQLASGAVYVQAKAQDGTVLQRSDSAIKLTTDTKIDAPLVLATKAVSQDDLARGTVVFREPVPSATAGKDTPATTSTPLENIKGIGPKTAARLRAAGIADVEAYVRTPTQKLVEIAGFDARVSQREAQKRVEKNK
jgi:predicted flap endonuclease-1-like 5' DNA nuclease